MKKSKIVCGLVLGMLGVAMSIGQGEIGRQNEDSADRWFMIRIKGQDAGYVHAVRKDSGDAAAPILLEYESLIDSKDDKVWMRIETYCEDNYYYYPAKARARIRKAGEEPASLDVVIKKNTPYGCSKGKMHIVYRPGDN